MNEMNKLQIMNAAGRYTDCNDRADEFLVRCSDFTGKNREEINQNLLNGEIMSIGTDWYNRIRFEPKPIKHQPVITVKCSCGHTVPKSQVMSASLGTSCPDCYDEMSD